MTRINFTLFSVLTLYFVNKLYLLFNQEGITNLFIFNLIGFISIISLSTNLSSPAPDFISVAIPLFILTYLIKPTDSNENTDTKSYIPILILCVYLITVKLATLPILIFGIFIIVKELKGLTITLIFMILSCFDRFFSFIN